MKKIYPVLSRIKNGLLLFLLPMALSSQVTYSFSTCGVTGVTGPTQAQANAAYTLTNLQGSVAVNNGIQSFTVPVSGPYRISAIGAQGGYNGGRGAYISGEFTLTAGTVLKILVGQQGTMLGNGTNSAGGGGGGSFIATAANVPLIVAGGGGGNGDGYNTGVPVPCCLSGMEATLTFSGNGYPSGGTNGGTLGNGGLCSGSFCAGGGAGFYGNGSICQSGSMPMAFVNGGAAGLNGGGLTGDGGFGGGAGCYNSGVGERGGGGGGYSGGGGGVANAGIDCAGGGGGSYNNGANPTNSISTGSGNGRVVIELLCNMMLYAATATSANLVSGASICSGNSVTLSVTGTSNYTWSTGNTTSSVIVVSPNVTTTYTVAATTSANCTAYNAITVTVSPGLPVLTLTASSTNTCLGSSIVLTAGGALSYSWTGGISNGVAFVPPSTAGYTVTGQNGCGTSTTSTTVTISPLAVSASASSNTVCANAPVTLMASSVGNYTYTWAPFGIQGTPVVLNPTATTVFTVTASNGTCSGTATLNMNVTPAPNVSIVSTNTQICSGESVTLTAQGGGQSYNWTPGGPANSIVVSPGSSSQYSLTATTAQGCSSGTTSIVLVNASPTLVISASNSTICAGGSATIVITGASGYTWSTMQNTPAIVVNPLLPNVYTVFGSNATNTCVSSASVMIDVFTPSLAVSGNTVVCDGGSATLTASGATSYTWEPNMSSPMITVTPSTSTVYTVNALASSEPGGSGILCPVSGTIQVNIDPSPTVTAGSSATNICKGETVILTAGGATSYTWTTSGATTASISVTPTVITTLMYNVTGANAQGCTNTALVQVKVNGCLGINENGLAENDLLIFPNPNNGQFRILHTSAVELYLINETGQLVATIRLNENNAYKADVSGLSNGIYFITGQNQGHAINRKVIIGN